MHHIFLQSTFAILTFGVCGFAKAHPAGNMSPESGRGEATLGSVACAHSLLMTRLERGHSGAESAPHPLRGTDRSATRAMVQQRLDVRLKTSH